MPESAGTLRLVIASDNFLTREGLASLLSTVQGIEVVTRVDSHPETLAAIEWYNPDVLVMGIRTPRTATEAAIAAASRTPDQPSLHRRGGDRRGRRRLRP